MTAEDPVLALVTWNLDDLWVYFVPHSRGRGSDLVVAWLHLPPLTATLCHDARYPSTLASELPFAEWSGRE